MEYLKFQQVKEQFLLNSNRILPRMIAPFAIVSVIWNFTKQIEGVELKCLLNNLKQLHTL